MEAPCHEPASKYNGTAMDAVSIGPIPDPTRSHMREPSLDEGFVVPEHIEVRIRQKLEMLYGRDAAAGCYEGIAGLLCQHHSYKPPEMIEWERDYDPRERFTHRDAVLIVYGDQMNGGPEPPLQILLKYTKKYLKGVFNTLHLLPFFPYSSDRGFAVTDFTQVDPRLGTWDDIMSINEHFKLIVDAVLNHVSSESEWFAGFLAGEPEYQDYFIWSPADEPISLEDLGLIVRPRTSPLQTRFDTALGPRLVWTTFGPDQIDLNYNHPPVLCRMVEVLLFYVRMGADTIRLDAMTYIWKELGTSCTHLEQAHTIVKLFRDILDAVAPHVALITETNTRHRFNIEYFGNGSDEAQMVYNFALPPLVLYTMITQDASELNAWARTLERVSDTSTYFNFLDSHDGIGLRGIREILDQGKIDLMVARVLENGGHVSYRDNGDGTQSPYELNITWHCAVNPMAVVEEEEFRIRRYLASRSIALVLMGVPGVYIHGLLGTMNDPEAMLTESEKRNINRSFLEKEHFVNIQEEDFPIAYRYVDMIRKRVSEPLFHPNTPQRILECGDCFFALVRSSEDGNDHVITLTNVTDSPQELRYSLSGEERRHEYWHDLLTGLFIEATDGDISLTVEPYGVLWLRSIS